MNSIIPKIPKAFLDFFIVFSGSESKEAPLRTDSGLKLVHEHDKKWKLYIQPNAAMPLISFAAKDRYSLWCFGEIFRYKDEDKPIEKILKIFIDELISGKEKPEELNGHFLIVCWDGVKREIIIWTDRLGTYHGFYSVNSKRKMIGSFFRGVAGVSSDKELDWIGITGFFGFGFFPKDSTYFKDIKIFYPASRYVFSENGELVKQARYWHWDFAPSERRSYKDTLFEFGETLKNALSDHAKSGRVALPISGGLDSRTLAALLPEKNSVWSFSYGWGDDSGELEIAGEVARIAGLPFKSFVIDPYLFDSLDMVVNSVEYFQDIAICRQAAVIDDIYAHADYVLAAHWGNVWCTDIGVEKHRSLKEDIAKSILKKFRKYSHDWLLEKICKPKLKILPEKVLNGLINEQMGNYNHINDVDFRIKAFKTDTWSFRWTLTSVRMYQPACFPRLPFYDNRIVDFFLSVPTEFVRERKLQIDYLRYFKPRFARIKWQPYDTDLFHHKYFGNLYLPKRFCKKIARILKQEIAVTRNWEAQFLYNKQGRHKLEERLLKRGLKLHEFIAPAEIRPLIEKLFSKCYDKDTGYTLSMLLTFSEWLERYA